MPRRRDASATGLSMPLPPASPGTVGGSDVSAAAPGQ